MENNNIVIGFADTNKLSLSVVSTMTMMIVALVLYKSPAAVAVKCYSCSDNSDVEFSGPECEGGNSSRLWKCEGDEQHRCFTLAWRWDDDEDEVSYIRGCASEFSNEDLGVDKLKKEHGAIQQWCRNEDGCNGKKLNPPRKGRRNESKSKSRPVPGLRDEDEEEEDEYDDADDQSPGLGPASAADCEDQSNDPEVLKCVQCTVLYTKVWTLDTCGTPLVKPKDCSEKSTHCVIMAWKGLRGEIDVIRGCSVGENPSTDELKKKQVTAMYCDEDGCNTQNLKLTKKSSTKKTASSRSGGLPPKVSSSSSSSAAAVAAVAEKKKTISKVVSPRVVATRPSRDEITHQLQLPKGRRRQQQRQPKGRQSNVSSSTSTSTAATPKSVDHYHQKSSCPPALAAPSVLLVTVLLALTLSVARIVGGIV